MAIAISSRIKRCSGYSTTQKLLNSNLRSIFTGWHGGSVLSLAITRAKEFHLSFCEQQKTVSIEEFKEKKTTFSNSYFHRVESSICLACRATAVIGS